MSAALQNAACFHCVVVEWKDCEEMRPKPKEKWNFVVKKREDTKHQTEWRATAGKYRCMQHVGEHDMARRMDGQGEVLICCRKCSRYARPRMGPKLMNRCKQ